MIDLHREALARQVGTALLARQWFLATAESCTGGLLAAAITEIAGSSTWFERGFITYSNQAKQELLGVSDTTLIRFGAVSEPTAIEMARGALNHSRAQVTVAITGIAGPTGGSVEKPVGTVCFAWALPQQDVHSCTQFFSGERSEVREQAVCFALSELLRLLS